MGKVSFIFNILGMKTDEFYMAKQIAAITGFSLSTIYEKISILYVAPEFTRNRINYYSERSFKIILKSLETAPKEKSFTKYYPLKTTETFYIYESKMNVKETFESFKKRTYTRLK